MNEKVIGKAATYGLKFIADNVFLAEKVNSLFCLMKHRIENGCNPGIEYESFIKDLEQLK